MLQQNKLPQLKIEGFSTAFKKKQPRTLQRDQENDENNQLVLKALIDKNVKQSKSTQKHTKPPSKPHTQRGRSTPLKQLPSELNPRTKQKPFLRLDHIEYSTRPKTTKSKSLTQMRPKKTEYPRKYSTKYPRSRSHSFQTLPLRMRNGKLFRVQRCSILNQPSKLPNEYSTLQAYLNSNELNLSLVIKQKLIHTNFLRQKPHPQQTNNPLRVFS